MLWDLSYTADNATEEWVAFYRCLELKSEIQTPENPEEYVSQSAGMKIEARSICYKYNVRDEEEVLKGTSFVLNPGESWGNSIVKYADNQLPWGRKINFGETADTSCQCHRRRTSSQRQQILFTPRLSP